jgi:hypothetical protein
MATYKVTAPRADFTGEIGGVGFYKGEANFAAAEGEFHGALSYFARKGYQIERLDAPAEPVEADEAEKKTARRTTSKGADQ